MSFCNKLGTNATRFLNLVFSISESRFDGYYLHADMTAFVGRMCGSLGADVTYPIHLSVECVVVWGRI